MTETEIGAIIFVSFVGSIVLLAVFCAIVLTIKAKYFEHKYKDVFDLIEKHSVNMSKSVDFYNDEICPLRNKIKRLIDGQIYLTVDDITENIKEIDNLKIELSKKTKEWSIKEDYLAEIKNEIEHLITDKNDKKFLKYMKDLGWWK